MVDLHDFDFDYLNIKMCEHLETLLINGYVSGWHKFEPTLIVTYKLRILIDTIYNKGKLRNTEDEHCKILTIKKRHIHLKCYIIGGSI